MLFFSAGTSYVAADCLKKRLSRKVLSLNGEGDREASFKEINVNSQFVRIYLRTICY